MQAAVKTVLGCWSLPPKWARHKDRHCSIPAQRPRAWRRRWALLLLSLQALFAQPSMAASCAAPVLRLERLAPGLWYVPAATGEANNSNRGHVSNLLLALDGPRLWLVGSGPTPAFARTLACQIKARWGREVTDVISPWPHPEAVLGLAGLPRVRSWAHADVAAAMGQRCPVCVGRLRERLGSAAADLEDDPVRVPTQLVHGEEGRLGPWHWRRLWRGDGTPVTAWRLLDTKLQGSSWRFAPGLLWGSGVPDGRDADVPTLARSTDQLAAWGATSPPRHGRWLGEQGPPLAAEAAEQQARYWHLLLSAVNDAMTSGALETDPPAPLTHFAGMADPANNVRHALNWQRAWRQEESRWFQRNLR